MSKDQAVSSSSDSIFEEMFGFFVDILALKPRDLYSIPDLHSNVTPYQTGSLKFNTAYSELQWKFSYKESGVLYNIKSLTTLACSSSSTRGVSVNDSSFWKHRKSTASNLIHWNVCLNKNMKATLRFSWNTSFMIAFDICLWMHFTYMSL